MSDEGWRRGDEAAWWDAKHRCWRRATLTERRTVPSYVYDITGDDGVSIAIPERLLRSIHDPGVTLDPPVAAPRAPHPPPRRAGSSLADRFKG